MWRTLDNAGRVKEIVGTGPILVARKQFSSAQILSLLSTPVEIVPAPPTGYLNLGFFGFALYKFGGTAYAVGGGSLIRIRDSGQTQASLAATILTNGSDQVATFGNFIYGPNDSDTVTGALAVSASVSNPTLGNGTLDVIVVYQLVARP